MMTFAACSGGGGVIIGSWIFETVNNTPAPAVPNLSGRSGPVAPPRRAQTAEPGLGFLPDLLHLDRADTRTRQIGMFRRSLDQHASGAGDAGFQVGHRSRK